MEKTPKKINITEHRPLVSSSKSKKLAAMANKLPATVASKPESPAPFTGLKSELEIELQKARVLIDERIDEIMNSFPQGKRNSLFRFRYGSVAEIKSLVITAAFKRLAIHHPINPRLLENRNYHGDTV